MRPALLRWPQFFSEQINASAFFSPAGEKLDNEFMHWKQRHRPKVHLDSRRVHEQIFGEVPMFCLINRAVKRRSSSIGCSHWRAQPNDTSNAGQDRPLTGSRSAFNRFPGGEPWSKNGRNIDGAIKLSSRCLG
jgi:hypothetical protein